MLIELSICEILYFHIFSGSYTHPSICHIGVIDGSKLNSKVEWANVIWWCMV